MYKQLTLEQRLEIERMYRTGVSVQKIAEAIGVARQTVYKELKHKNAEGVYDARESQKRHEALLRKKGHLPLIAQNPLLQQYLYNKLVVEKKTVEAAARELAQEKDPRLGHANRQTICTAIKAGYIPDLTWEMYRNHCATIQKDGSLYLPKWFLEKQGLEPGQQFELSEEDGRIVLTKIVRDKEEEQA